MNKNQKGFSAVELLIVITLIGVVGSMGWRVYVSKFRTPNVNYQYVTPDEFIKSEVNRICDGAYTCSEMNEETVQKSKEELVRSGFSSEYIDKHFRPVIYYASSADTHRMQSVYWAFVMDDYVRIYRMNYEYRFGLEPDRWVGGTGRNLGDVLQTIPPKEALEKIAACGGEIIQPNEALEVSFGANREKKTTLMINRIKRGERDRLKLDQPHSFGDDAPATISLDLVTGECTKRDAIPASQLPM